MGSLNIMKYHFTDNQYDPNQKPNRFIFVETVKLTLKF